MTDKNKAHPDYSEVSIFALAKAVRAREIAKELKELQTAAANNPDQETSYLEKIGQRVKELTDEARSIRAYATVDPMVATYLEADRTGRIGDAVRSAVLDATERINRVTGI